MADNWFLYNIWLLSHNDNNNNYCFMDDHQWLLSVTDIKFMNDYRVLVLLMVMECYLYSCRWLIYGCGVLSMVVDGYVWLWSVICGCGWLYMVVECYLWLWMVIHGY